jgi:hypothetical protein
MGTPARRGELLAELGQPGRTHLQATKEWDNRSRWIPMARCVASPTPCALDWPPRRGPVHNATSHTRQGVGPSPAEAARTPSQALTGTMRRRGSRSDPTGVSIPLRRRLPWPVTPRGGRSRRFEETAYGTERFLGRDLRHGRRPLTRHGSSGPDPV